MTRKVLLGVVLLAVAAAGVAWRQGLLFKKPLVVAVVAPLTGRDARAGAGLRNGALLAVEEVNAKGGVQGRKVELLEVDDPEEYEKGKPTGDRVAADPRVLAVTGFFHAGTYWSSHASFGVPKVPSVVSGFWGRENVHLFKSADSEFSLHPMGVDLAMPLARWSWEVLGARQHLYVREDSWEGQCKVNLMRAALSKLLGHVVSGDEQVSADASDFSALVAKVEREKPDLVFYGGRPGQAALLLKQLRAAGLAVQFAFLAHEPTDDFFALAKEAAEGTVTLLPAKPLEDTGPGKTFSARYQARGFAEPAGYWGFYGYLGAQALLVAMERSFLTRASIGGALKNESLPTVAGDVKYFVGGSTFPTPTVLYRAQGGRWVPFSAPGKDGKLGPYVP
jgi:branched-chain amino acid transport system substrate-binding protein